jgi:hypothetical protein
MQAPESLEILMFERRDVLPRDVSRLSHVVLSFLGFSSRGACQDHGRLQGELTATKILFRTDRAKDLDGTTELILTFAE